ncbi:hypothetical protein P0Y35_12690 [Kiritimatiellaeota bacterium B1221]|nr:hypothetical protein [Kiritimatiellaeota bacterium B1221]
MFSFRLLIFLILNSFTFAEPLYYSFRNESGGGIARLEADPASGKILAHTPLIASPAFQNIYKLAVSPDGQFIAANLDDVENHENLILLKSDGQYQRLSIKSEINELRFFQQHLYLGTTRGCVLRIDPDTGRVLHTWDFRKLLSPGGKRPEDFAFDHMHGILWISFQKDSKGRKHQGSRIVGIDLRSDKVIADLQLPRDHPELHYSPEIDGRESGPNPEVLFIDPPSNTLFVTLDLYGAVGMADLDAAMRGELKNWTTHSTAPDHSWGSAFPDRVGSYVHNNRKFLLVANSGKDGGTAVVDLQNRAITQILNSPHGLSSLWQIPRAGSMVSGNSGKLKTRGKAGLEKEKRMSPHWLQFDVQSDKVTVSNKSMSQPIHQVAPVNIQQSPLVYVNMGDNVHTWNIFTPQNDQPHDSVEAFGKVQRCHATHPLN